MDTIRLRTMTEKSIIGFGKFTDISVQNLIDMKKTREIRWIYFNCSLLSFKDNILDWAGITDEYRIEKPGTNKELYYQLNDEKKKKLSGFAILKKDCHTRKVLQQSFRSDLNNQTFFYPSANRLLLRLKTSRP